MPMQPSQPSSEPEFKLDLDPVKRREFVASCNDRLITARNHHMQLCLEGGGIDSCRQLTTEVDAIMKSVYDWLVEEACLDSADCDRIAVIAQGGYGRAVLNLHSDVDVLFLMPENSRPSEQAFIRSFLYILWDLAKFDLGYAVKKPSEALAAVGSDLDSTTALINMRLIAGNKFAVDELAHNLSKRLSGSGRRWFVESKVAEWRNRREKFGSSVYLLEPNVKDGEGGLRDVHSLQWLSFVLLETSSLEILVERDILEPEELLRVLQGLDFLLSVRTLLHSIDGRKQDALTFDKQPAVARALNYTSDAQLLAEERMMKDYYLHARTIDRYSQKATRILTLRAQNSREISPEGNRPKTIDAHYHQRDGVMFLNDAHSTLFIDEPWRVMDCFRIAARKKVVLSEELKDHIMAARSVTDTEAFRSSVRCRDIFMEIMGLRSGTADAVHAMHDTEILNDYMPEFRKLFCLVRIDHYHRYTVDEHLIKCVEASEALLDDSKIHRPELVVVAHSIGRRDLLNLAILLHDIGKGEGHGHVLRGAIISKHMTQRMGLNADEQEIVRQLILQHLRMAHISQRRDLEDPTVIHEMANHVHDAELLKMLYILTYCDTRSVGPNTWSDWKAILLFDLFRKTMLVLEGKNPIPAVDEDTRLRVTRELRELLDSSFEPAVIERFVNNASSKYLNLNPPVKMARHLRMLEHLSPEHRIYWESDEPPGMNYTEITAVSYDRPGFMSHVCGALASKDVNILSVQVFSTSDGYAIDTFQVTNLLGDKLPTGFRLDRLRDDLNTVLLGQAKPEEKFPRRKPRRARQAEVSVKKPAQLIFDNDSSPDFTVLEVKAHDRPGLLYDITHICAEQGYYIHLAMITTEAYRVVDVFYVTDLEFNKMTPAQIKKLHAALEPII
ncbi:[protein-PII] uridylyltransferase [candidate division BRC1 bacterium HGW-BRC1-1]|nr:MAG: [protein-PII] uridylyltransferase [candidate division BRC1 bacterium HGW-BRC1-1]